MQAQAVEQLRFIGGHQCRQAGCFSSLGVVCVHGTDHLGHGLEHGHALQHGTHLFERGGGRQPVHAQRVRGLHHGFPVTLGERFDEPEHIGAVHRTQHLAHTGFLQLAAAKGNGLVGQRQCIAHGAPRSA